MPSYLFKTVVVVISFALSIPRTKRSQYCSAEDSPIRTLLALNGLQICSEDGDDVLTPSTVGIAFLFVVLKPSERPSKHLKLIIRQGGENTHMYQGGEYIKYLIP